MGWLHVKESKENFSRGKAFRKETSYILAGGGVTKLEASALSSNNSENVD